MYYKDLPVDSQIKTFYISIKFIAVFHVKISPQLRFSVNSIICKHEKILNKPFQPIWYSQYNINSTFKLKRKLGWRLELFFCDVKMKFRYYLKFSTNVFKSNPNSLRMHVDHFESCETILDRFQTPSIFSHSWLVPKSPGRNSSTASAEKFYYSFYYDERLENKVTRGPLLGLAKYIYLYVYLN